MSRSFQSLIAAGQEVRAGTTTFQALAEQSLERIEKNRALNGFEQVFPEAALKAAKAQDLLLQAGYDLGPLQGIPIALKSNIAMTGVALTAGSQILAQHIAQKDAEITRRLRRAGAVIMGVTNMHEFAWGGTTSNPHYGQAHNPLAPGHSPGGSSGGSGTVVASGEVFAALGTDTGGSVRLPAAMNGLVGLRPGIGRLPVDGILPLAWSLDTVGPMARDAGDLAALYTAMSDAPSSLSKVPHCPRIAVPRRYIEAAIEPVVLERFNLWLAAQRAAGAEVVDVEIAQMDEAVDALVIVDAAEPTAIHESWLHQYSAQYGPDVLAQLLAGKCLTASDYLHAQRFRMAFRLQILQLLARFDVIAMPTIAFLAPKIGQERITLSGVSQDTLTALMRFTALASCTGLPAISFPAPQSEMGGLPASIQLIGNDGAEASLIEFAQTK